MNHYHTRKDKSLIFIYIFLGITPILLTLIIPFSASAKSFSDRQISYHSSQKTIPTNLIAQAQSKPKVAVLDFDFSSVSNPSILSVLPGGSKGVSDILVNKLVEGGSYSVIERSKLDAVLQEQNLGASGRVDASTAAQIGRILGVEAVVIGSVTQFDLQQRNSGFNLFGIGVGGDDTDAYVKLNIRVVSTSTAEILMVAEGNGNTSQSDNQVQVFGIGGGSSTSNEGKLLTLATQQAIEQVTQSLNSNSSKMVSLPKALPTINATVADVSGGTVVLNKGQSDGYQKGMRMSIERVSKTVKDPQTGAVLRQITQPVGTIELSDVDGKSSVGKIISGASFKVGDVAKPIQ
jgi:curli biogenesis system outer membrane secretion channel CsgG